MSIYTTLQTAVSGMAAQATKLSTIGDNIANASTTGYKDASVEFETLLGSTAASYYESGAVQSRIRYGVSQQGEIAGTSSTTDLAIKGNGFFVVQTTGTATALTRSGSFVPDATGSLVNAAGYKLMGYNLTDGTYNASSGIGALQAVNISSQGLTATASQSGTLSVNLPSTATAVIAANLPSANASTAVYTQKTSLVAFDNLGTVVNLDVFMTKTGSNTWEVSVFNAAARGTGGGFPYSSPAMATQNLTFDPTSGRLATTSATAVNVPIANGKTVAIDLSQSTQLASNYNLAIGTVDGNAPSSVANITIAEDGTVSTVYQSGATTKNFRIPLANVQSPDEMTSLPGNIYQTNQNSGSMTLGVASTGTLGKIESNSLESSTVDLATELTSMISTQRSYEANSKVLTTGSEMLSTIIQAIHS